MTCTFKGCEETDIGGKLTMRVQAEYVGGGFLADVMIEGEVCAWHMAMLRRKTLELYGSEPDHVDAAGGRWFTDGVWRIRVNENSIDMEHESAAAASL